MRYNIVFTAAAMTATALAVAPESVPGMNIVWSDDFSGSGDFNKTNWQYYNGPISNGEQEQYPAFGEYCELSGNGSLLITPENNNGQWSSCRIETINSWAPPEGGKVQFQSRFKLGTPGVNLQGIWPAFWALGQSMRNGIPWPACGEIDTFENVSGGPLGYGTLHCGSSCNGSGGLSSGIPFTHGDFHTWSHVVDRTNHDWTQQSITWFMDGQSYHEIYGSQLNNEGDWKAVAQSAMYITLNVAVGGSWPGPVSPQTASGKDAGMEIQYVAVYQSTS